MTSDNYAVRRQIEKWRDIDENGVQPDEVLVMLLEPGSILSRGCWGRVEFWPLSSTLEGRIEVSSRVGVFTSHLIDWRWHWSHYEGRLTAEGRKHAEDLKRQTNKD